MQQESKSLAQRSLQAIKWNYLGTFVRVLSQFFAQIALARILGPEVIGSFGYALLLGGLLGVFIEQGLSWALIHANSVSDHETKIAFSRVMLAALLCSLVSFFFADEIARLMGAAEAARTLRYFSPAFLFMGLTVVAQASFRKSLRFKEIQIAQVASYLIAYPIVGVALAIAGLGVLSLVIAWVLQSALTFFILNLYAAQRLRFTNPFSPVAFGKYSRDILTINMVNWIVDNAGAVFIARLFGAAPLGLYNTTLALVRTPANHLVVNLQTVLFPTAAAAKADLVLVGRLYSTALSVVLFVAIPVFSFVAVAAPAIVSALLGAKWLAATSLLPPIALAMIPHVVSGISGSTLSGQGNQRVELASQALVLVLLIGCYLVLPLTSAVQVCWLFLLLYLIRSVFLTVVASRKMHLHYTGMLQVFGGPSLIAVIGGGIYGAFESVPGLSHVTLVLGGACLFALTGLAGLTLMPRLFVAEPMRQLFCRYREGKGIVAVVARWLTR